MCYLADHTVYSLSRVTLGDMLLYRLIVPAATTPSPPHFGHARVIVEPQIVRSPEASAADDKNTT